MLISQYSLVSIYLYHMIRRLRALSLIKAVTLSKLSQSCRFYSYITYLSTMMIVLEIFLNDFTGDYEIGSQHEILSAQYVHQGLPLIVFHIFCLLLREKMNENIEVWKFLFFFFQKIF